MTSEHIINDYQALVRSLALSYQNKGIEIEDLIQEGFIGLLEAQKHFNAAQHVKFSTYAVFWIKKYILQALEIEYNSIPKTSSINNGNAEPLLSDSDNTPFRTNADFNGIKMPSDLPFIEQKVIRLSYEQCLPLKEISQKLGISIERVRQIRQKALRRIKSKYQTEKQ